MPQALCPVLRQTVSTSAIALLLVAGPILPGVDELVGAIQSAMAAPAGGGGATTSGGTKAGTGAAGTGTSGGGAAAGGPRLTGIGK